MFETVLVAGRGESAVRIIETCRRLGVKSIAVHSEADRDALAVRMSDEAVLLGPEPAAESYLDVHRILEAAALSGAEAIHPATGPLANDPEAARAIQRAGQVWIGPSPEVIAATADRAAFCGRVADAGLPVAVEGDRWPAARHVEVQLLGLRDARVLALGERDCSIRQRGRRLAAEAPAGLPDEVRKRMHRAARAVGELLDYQGAGSVEFLLDVQSGDFGCCGMDAALPADRAVTELVTGVDLAEQQLLIAAGEPPSFDSDEVSVHGHAVSVRLDAAEPGRRITGWEMPDGDGVRVDAGHAKGDTVPRSYDPLLATVAAWAPERAEAVRRLRSALGACRIEGPGSNLPLLRTILADPRYGEGTYDSGLLAQLSDPVA